MRRHPTDKRLWAICALAVFVVFVFIDPKWGKGNSSLWHHANTLFNGKWASTSDGVVTVAFLVVALAIPAIIIGWLLHAIAVMCGIRLTRTTETQQNADYDDAGSSGR